MTIESELRTRLIAAATSAASRIYPQKLPQDPTYPALTFQRVSGARVGNLAGAAGRAKPRITFSCWAQTYVAAQALAAEVRASLNGFKGTLTTISADIALENEIDDFDDVVNVHRVIQDYFVAHVET